MSLPVPIVSFRGPCVAGPADDYCVPIAARPFHGKDPTTSVRRRMAGPVLLALLVSASLLPPSVATAVTYNWVGNDPFSPNWNLIFNWEFLSVPPNNGSAHVNFGNTTGSHTPTVNQNWFVGRVTFSSPASYVVLSSGGAVLSVGGWISNVTSGTAVNHGFLCPIQVMQFQTWENLADTPTSVLSFNGPVNVGPYELTLAPEAGAPIAVGGAISGAGSVRVAGGSPLATVTFSGANTYSGGTEIANAALKAGANNVIPAGPILVNGGGTLDLTGYQETIGPGAATEVGLVLGGGRVYSPTHPVAIATLGTFISGGNGSVGGRLTLGTGTSTRTIVVGGGLSDPDELTIDADIENPAGVPGPNAAIGKSGLGRLVLSGANTFNRAVTVGEGSLRVASDLGLGQGGYGNETRVGDWGTLELTGGVTVAAESLQVNCGQADHQVRNVAGDNTWSGPVRFNCDGRIRVEAGSSLLVSGKIEGGPLVRKDGPGELSFSAANTYFGTTEVAEGTLKVTNSTGSATGASTVQLWPGTSLKSPGGGRIDGIVFANVGGNIIPGGFGTMRVGGLVLGPSAYLWMKAAGFGPGDPRDRVEVAGVAQLSGHLVVEFTQPLTPTVGDSLVLMTYTYYSGAFTSVGLPDLTGGATWELDYGATQLVARVKGSLGVGDENPTVSRLRSVAPSPFMSRTTVRYELSRASHVELAVFDVRGALVATLADHEQPAGAYDVEWTGEGSDGARLPGGLYFVRLMLDGQAIGVAVRVALVR